MGVDYYIKNYILGFPLEEGRFLLIALFIGAILIICNKRLKNRWSFFCKYLLSLFVVLLFIITFFTRTYREGIAYNFQPFWSYYEAIVKGRSAMAAEVIMNIVFFIPLGILLGLSFKVIKWYHVLLVSLGISMAIELLQFVFNRGFAEFDDLFNNVLGSLIGFGLFKLVKASYERFGKENMAILFISILAEIRKKQAIRL